MSADEDTELRDLVAQALEANGVLGKIRAQLRANVFLALEEQESVKNKTPLLNKELRKFFSENEGILVGALIRDFLRHFNLDYTLCVFDPEAEWHGDAKAQFDSREELAQELNITETNETRSKPLLAEVLRRGLKTESSSANPLVSAQVKKTETGTVQKKLIQSDNSDTLLRKSPSLERQSSDDQSLSEELLPLGLKSHNDQKGKPVYGNVHEEVKDSSTIQQKTTADSVKQKNEKSELSSLSSLPPLDNKKTQPAEKLNFYDEYEDDFEDDGNDFERSNVSPMGQTPRSARSDHSSKGMWGVDKKRDDDDNEDIEEVMSEEDLVTSDRTVSPSESHVQGDYSEDVNPLSSQK